MQQALQSHNRLTIYGLFIIFIFSLFYCFDYLLQISISVFLPVIKSSFALNNFQLGLIGSVFFITYVFMQIPGGYFIDRFGAWKIALWMSLLCCLGALLMYFSVHSYSLLLLSRLFIGLGSSVAFLSAIQVIALYSPFRYFSLFIGLLQALAGVGAISGQSPIAYLNLYYPWNEIALLFFILSLIFSVFFLLFLRKHKTPQVHVSAERVTFRSIVQLLKDKNLLYISALSFISWAPVASLAGFWLVQYLRDVNHMNTVAVGFMISSFWIGMIVGSIVIPVISEWNKRRKPVLLFGFGLQLIAMVMILQVPDKQNILALALFLLGFMSPIQGFCVVLYKDTNSHQNLGIASGIINFFGTVSGGTMQFLVGFLLTYVFAHFAKPYVWSFSAYIVLALFGLGICAFAYQESHPLRQTERKKCDVPS